jgi:hypothetical protein
MSTTCEIEDKPKRRVYGKRSKPIKLDGRTRHAKRIKALVALYTGSLPESELTPLKREMIREAAVLKGMAEYLRFKFARDGEVKGARLSEVLTLEARASEAVAALGLQDTKPKPADSMLVDYFTRGK